MHLVDHANPLHDHFCRCPACKPAPNTNAVSRLKVALLVAIVAVVALLVFA